MGAVGLGLLLACNEDTSSTPVTDAQACTALGSAVGVAGLAAPYGSPPAPVLVASSASRYDLTLPASPAPGAYSGIVHWQVSQPGQYGIYAAPSITFLVRDESSAIMPFVKSLGSALSCDSIGRHVFLEVPVGSYTVELGPSTRSDLRLVLLPVAPGEEI